MYLANICMGICKSLNYPCNLKKILLNKLQFYVTHFFCVPGHCAKPEFHEIFLFYKYRILHPWSHPRKGCHQAFLSRLMRRLLTFHLAWKIFVIEIICQFLKGLNLNQIKPGILESVVSSVLTLLVSVPVKCTQVNFQFYLSGLF